MSRKPSRSPALGAFLCLCASALLSGCTVVAVTATAVSVTASAVGLAADAAVGTAKIVGKAVDAMSDDGAAADNSGITVRYRTPDGQPLTP